MFRERRTSTDADVPPCATLMLVSSFLPMPSFSLCHTGCQCRIVVGKRAQSELSTGKALGKEEDDSLLAEGLDHLLEERFLPVETRVFRKDVETRVFRKDVDDI